MYVTITAAQDAKPLTITGREVDWEDLQGGRFYQGEQQVQQLLNRVGHALTRQLLAGKVTRPPRLRHAGQRWYRRPTVQVITSRSLGRSVCPVPPTRAAAGVRPSARWRGTVNSPLTQPPRYWPTLSATN